MRPRQFERRTGNSANSLPFYLATGVLQLRHGVPSMCDYSLELVSSRPAKVGDKLVSAGFPHTIPRGFASVEDPTVAVCLLPGTELAFEAVSYTHLRAHETP